ncbi:hypothetical protein QTO34_004206 [Cnephaeus nilssonii]|uniref:Ig-like domain-containing protein n=1 Tax=Cnephaeus nilssonii TaxID=3371016 RepID=A0AA40HS38_CNENI|nr:hypothetical protein QTO34_004206 [Eptesicus nilssonii]
MLLPKLSSQPAAQLKEDAGSARDPAVARPELEGARLLPALRDREGRGAGAQAGGRAAWAPRRLLLRLERFQGRAQRRGLRARPAVLPLLLPAPRTPPPPSPSAASPAAGSSSALSPLTFPVLRAHRAPGRRGTADRGPPARCALGLVPAPLARSAETSAMPGAGGRGAAPARWLGAGILGLFLLPATLALEVSVGKAATIYAVNGTEVLLPCTFSSCFGFHNLAFSWSYNSSDAFRVLISGTVKNEKADPRLQLKSDDRITLEGSTKEKKNNLSILLRDLDFGDTGRYTCHVRNPKEKDLQHQATIFLQVVDKLEEVDNTLTLIIVSVVGGVVGLLVLILLIKKLVTFILKKTREKK